MADDPERRRRHHHRSRPDQDPDGAAPSRRGDEETTSQSTRHHHRRREPAAAVPASDVDPEPSAPPPSAPRRTTPVATPTPPISPPPVRPVPTVTSSASTPALSALSFVTPNPELHRVMNQKIAAERKREEQLREDFKAGIQGVVAVTSLEGQVKQLQEENSRLNGKVNDLVARLENAEARAEETRKTLDETRDALAEAAMSSLNKATAAAKAHTELKASVERQFQALTQVVQDITEKANVDRAAIAEQKESLNTTMQGLLEHAQKSKEKEEENKTKFKELTDVAVELQRRIQCLALDNDASFFLLKLIYWAEPSYSQKGYSEQAILLFYCLKGLNVFAGTCSDLLSAVSGAITDTVTRQKHDPGMLAFWLSTCTSLFYLTRTAVKRGTDESDKPLKKFLVHLEQLIATCFMTLFTSLRTRIEPVLCSAFLEMPFLNFDGDHGLSVSGTSAAIPSERGDVLAAEAASAQAVCKILQPFYLALQNALVRPGYSGLMNSFFFQMFTLIDAYLFNSLMQSRNFSSAANGIRIKETVCELMDWIKLVNLPDNCLSALDHINEAARLNLIDKGILDAPLLDEICPTMNGAQIRQLFDYYTPREDEDPISNEVRLLADARGRARGGAGQLLLPTEGFPSAPWDLIRADKGLSVSLSEVKIPRWLAERPSFAFLMESRAARPSSNRREESSSRHHRRDDSDAGSLRHHRSHHRSSHR
eukprot:gnl/Spiro4/27165_TR13508_c0_g1_i1.p1 gnl/Spiro4/27165_TR13508_c0_g1~~gnl/Spiro4/27165_TR13508_c0_g1_i1.p1  ORF type:complete len:725 (+),score=147.33 gnl/Spiro4/27165_TR13508_c0_g1_i1:48-2177(+)